MSEWWNRPTEQPSRDGGAGTGEQEPTVECPWCSTGAAPGATHCTGCGAVMAQRESLGGMIIPGVTDVDPGMRVPTVTGSAISAQARMSTISMAGRIGGTSAQVAVVAGMLAKDSLSGMFQAAPNIEDVGKTSQAALDMAARLSAGAEPEATTNAAAGDEKPDKDDIVDPSFWAPARDLDR